MFSYNVNINTFHYQLFLSSSWKWCLPIFGPLKHFLIVVLYNILVFVVISSFNRSASKHIYENVELKQPYILKRTRELRKPDVTDLSP